MRRLWMILALWMLGITLPAQTYFVRNGSDWLTQPFFESQCTKLLQRYTTALNELGNPIKPISEKARLIHQFQERFWNSDSVIIYDDLYRYGDGRQYFTGTAYLQTIPSWYPSGMQIRIGQIQLLELVWEGNQWIQVTLEWQRSLTGTDFLGMSQSDSLCLHGVVRFPVTASEQGLQIGQPKFQFIQLAELATQRLDTVQTSVVPSMPLDSASENDLAASDSISGGIPPMQEPEGIPDPALDRDRRLLSAYAAYTQLRLLSRGKRQRRPPETVHAWQPW